MDNISTFNIFRIGPVLAELISEIEKKEYTFKIADYKAVVWDWNSKYPIHVGSIDESCFVITTDKEKHPIFNENICLAREFNNPRDDNMICLGLNNYKHLYRPNIIDGKVSFYNYLDNTKQRLLDIPYQDIIYEFVDTIIEYKESNNNVDLSSQQLTSLLQDFLLKRLSNNATLKRKKDV